MHRARAQRSSVTHTEAKKVNPDTVRGYNRGVSSIMFLSTNAQAASSHDQPYPVESKFKFGAKYSSHHHNNGARERAYLSFPLSGTHTLSLFPTLPPTAAPPLGLEWVKNFSRGSEKWHLFSRIYDTAFSSAVLFSTKLLACTSPITLIIHSSFLPHCFIIKGLCCLTRKCRI